MDEETINSSRELSRFISEITVENARLKEGLRKVIVEHYRPETEKYPDWAEIEYWQDYLEEITHSSINTNSEKEK